MKVNSQSGFTIIEIMMAILVLSILTTMAIPSFGSFISNNRITAQANTFHSALLYARSEAVKRNTQVAVCGTSDPTATNPCGTSGSSWTEGWMMFVDENSNNQFESGDTVLRTQEAISGGGSINASGNIVAYADDGRLAAGNTSFTFCDAKNNNDYTRQLSISPLGSPKVKKAGTCP